MRIPCPRCHGKGTVKVPAHVSATLAAIGADKIDSVVLATRLDMKPTAVNNRLERMRAAGLLKRVAGSNAGGRPVWLYSQSPNEKPNK